LHLEKEIQRKNIFLLDKTIFLWYNPCINKNLGRGAMFKSHPTTCAKTQRAKGKIAETLYLFRGIRVGLQHKMLPTVTAMWRAIV